MACCLYDTSGGRVCVSNEILWGRWEGREHGRDVGCGRRTAANVYTAEEDGNYAFLRQWWSCYIRPVGEVLVRPSEDQRV